MTARVRARPRRPLGLGAPLTTTRDLDQVGKLDPLIVGRVHVVYERGERPAGA